MKTCTKCSLEKPLPEFSKDKKTRDGLHIWCKMCCRDYNRLWREEHKKEVIVCSMRYRNKNSKKIAAYDKTYQENNRERISRWKKEYHRKNPKKALLGGIRRRACKAKAEGQATLEQIKSRWDLYGGLCYLCGDKGTDTDHVIPLSKGGTNWPANLRPACESCNSSKHAKWPYVAAMIPMIPNIGGTGLDTVSQVCYNGSR